MSQASSVHETVTQQEIAQPLRVSRALVAFGANLSTNDAPPAETIGSALNTLQTRGMHLRARSRLWRTPCMPVGAGPDYVNAVALFETRTRARDTLAILHAVEAAFDRRRDTRWAARTLDLDLIDQDGAIWPDAATQAHWRGLDPQRAARATPDRLILPHPRLQERAFVLIPLAEAAPGWIDPVSGLSVERLIAALPDGALDGMRPIADHAW